MSKKMPRKKFHLHAKKKNFPDDMFSQRHHFISTIKFRWHFSRKFTSSHIFFLLNFISLLSQSQHRFYKRFLQHVALFSSKLASQRETIRQNAKAPEAGKPASRAFKLKCQNELLYFSVFTVMLYRQPHVIKYIWSR